jgi:hypothetical protein
VSNELKQQGDGAGESLKNDKLRVAGHGLGNTRARRTNNAKRAPNMPMRHGHVPVQVGTVFILSIGTCTLAPSGYGYYVNQKKHESTTCIEKKKIHVSR